MNRRQFIKASGAALVIPFVQLAAELTHAPVHRTVDASMLPFEFVDFGQYSTGDRVMLFDGCGDDEEVVVLSPAMVSHDGITWELLS